MAISGTSVNTLQYALLSLGFHPGKPDGIDGPQTHAALQQFCTQSGLPANATPEEVQQRLLCEAQKKTAALHDKFPKLSAEETRQYQAGLHSLGLNSGPLDGIIGPITTSASAQYRAHQQAEKVVGPAASAEYPQRMPDTGERPVVILSVGHGWFKDDQGKKYFDPGATVVDPKTGKSVTEYEINQQFAAVLAKTYTKAGMDVKVVSGTEDHPQETRFQNAINVARAARAEGRQVMFVGVHANMDVTNASHGAVVYHHEDTEKMESSSPLFAQMLAGNLGPLAAAGKPERQTRTTILQPGTYLSPRGEDNSVREGLGTIPAALVETGFLSNAENLEQLRNPAYQQALADRIVAGSTAYASLERTAQFAALETASGKLPLPSKAPAQRAVG